MPEPHSEVRLHDESGRIASGGTDKLFKVPFAHRVRFTRDVFNPANPILRDLLAADGQATGRAIVFVDDGVWRAWPDLDRDIRRSAAACGDALKVIGPVRVVPGGEQAKNGWTVYETVARAISDAAICRHSFVLVIGGGAVLDAVGFAASTAHRGVRLIRFPTTTLAQDDSGVGVKNGINAFGKKNFLGSFTPPWAVINDERFLETLSDRDWRSGLSEAVKVALLKDADFFYRINDSAGVLAQRDALAAAPVIRRSAELHLAHIVEGGDPFELLNARPLDFGHWSAHKLEQLTEFQLRHGEAVAIGIALDCVYASLIGLLMEADAQRILRCLARLGFCLWNQALEDHEPLLEGLREFREHLGGRLTITLLRGIGEPVDVHEIERCRMIEAIGRLHRVACDLGADRSAFEDQSLLLRRG